MGVKMVTQLPLEYVHLVLLGATKRLINYWVQDKFAFVERSVIDKSNLKLLQLNVFLTADFNREHRSFSDIGRWKETDIC